jgi:hypothetical protein
VNPLVQFFDRIRNLLPGVWGLPHLAGDGGIDEVAGGGQLEPDGNSYIRAESSSWSTSPPVRFGLPPSCRFAEQRAYAFERLHHRQSFGAAANLTEGSIRLFHPAA